MDRLVCWRPRQAARSSSNLRRATCRLEHRSSRSMRLLGVPTCIRLRREASDHDLIHDLRDAARGDPTTTRRAGAITTPGLLPLLRRQLGSRRSIQCVALEALKCSVRSTTRATCSGVIASKGPAAQCVSEQAGEACRHVALLPAPDRWLAFVCHRPVSIVP